MFGRVACSRIALAVLSVVLFSSFGFAWLSGWEYRRPVTVELNDSTPSFTYSAVVNVSGAKSDCSDVRVTDSSDNILDYYVYDCDVSGSGNAMILWNYTGGNYTFYVYYGNPDEVMVYDDFEDGTLNEKKWQANAVGTVNYTETGGYLEVTGAAQGTGSEYWIYDSTDAGSQIRMLSPVDDSIRISYNMSVTNTVSTNMYEAGVAFTNPDGTLGVFWGPSDWVSSAISHTIAGVTETSWTLDTSDTSWTIDSTGTGTNNRLRKDVGTYPSVMNFTIEKNGTTVYVYYQGELIAHTTLSENTPFASLAFGAYAGTTFADSVKFYNVNVSGSRGWTGFTSFYDGFETGVLSADWTNAGTIGPGFTAGLEGVYALDFSDTDTTNSVNIYRNQVPAANSKYFIMFKGGTGYDYITPEFQTADGSYRLVRWVVDSAGNVQAYYSSAWNTIGTIPGAITDVYVAIVSVHASSYDLQICSISGSCSLFTSIPFTGATTTYTFNPIIATQGTTTTNSTIDEVSVGYGAASPESYTIGAQETPFNINFLGPSDGETEIGFNAYVKFNCTVDENVTVYLDGVQKETVECNASQAYYIKSYTASEGQHNFTLEDSTASMTRTFTLSRVKVNTLTLSDVNETEDAVVELNVTVASDTTNSIVFGAVIEYDYYNQSWSVGQYCFGDVATDYAIAWALQEQTTGAYEQNLTVYYYTANVTTPLVLSSDEQHNLTANLTLYTMSNVGICSLQSEAQANTTHTVSKYYNVTLSAESPALETVDFTANATIAEPPGGQATWTYTLTFQGQDWPCTLSGTEYTCTLYPQPESSASADYTANMTVTFSYLDRTRNESSASTVTVYSFHVDDCTTYATKALEYIAYNESSNTQILNVTWGTYGSYWAVASRLVKNFSWNKTSDTLAWCITPSWATLHLNATTQASKSGFNTLTYIEYNTSLDNTTNTRGLYLYESTAANVYPVTVRVINEYGQALSGYMIYAQKWFYEDGAYISIAGTTTDDNGQAVFYLKLYDTYYKFLIMSPSGEIVHETNPTTLSSQTYTIQVDTSQYQTQYWFQGITASCSYNQTTHVIRCTAADPNNYMTRATLTAWTGGIIRQTVCDNTAEGSSVTITCDLSNVSTWHEIEYEFTGWYENTPHTLWTGSITGAPISQENKNFNALLMLFAVGAVLLAVAAAAHTSASTLVVLAVVIVATSIAGGLTGSMTPAVLIMLAAAILAYWRESR